MAALPPVDETRAAGMLAIAIVGSLLFHLLGLPGLMMVGESLGWMTPPESFVVPLPMDIEVMDIEEPEPEVEEPEPEVEEPEPEVEEPEPVRQPPPVRQAAPEEPAPQQAPDEPQPEEPEPLDLTGLTLTAEGGDGFAVPTGNGQEREGPIGPPPRRATSPTGMGMGGGGGEAGGTGPPVVAASNLSRQPAPGRGAQAVLAACLVDEYPAQARAQGIEGLVLVTLRINPDGRIMRVRTRTETPRGQTFARACSRCFRRLRPWTSPLDRHGNPVATDFPGRCGFTVRN